MLVEDLPDDRPRILGPVLPPAAHVFDHAGEFAVLGLGRVRTVRVHPSPHTLPAYRVDGNGDLASTSNRRSASVHQFRVALSHTSESLKAGVGKAVSDLVSRFVVGAVDDMALALAVHGGGQMCAVGRAVVLDCELLATV